MSYCPDCNNTGIDLEGNICHCQLNQDAFINEAECLDIPEQYRGIAFTSSLLPSDMGDAYKRAMQEIYDSIVSRKMKFKNMVICSPQSRGKTIMVYSIIQSLFRRDVPIFPLYDVLEVKRMLMDMDFNRKSLYDIKDPMVLLTCPYLFIKVPPSTTFEVYETMYTIIDRRVRRGNSTLFIYNGSWEQLTYNDSKGTLKNMLGDGSYSSIENQTWRSK